MHNTKHSFISPLYVIWLSPKNTSFRLLCCLCLLWTTPLYQLPAQDSISLSQKEKSVHAFNRETWENAIKDLNFRKKIPPGEKLPDLDFNTDFWSPFFKIFFASIGIIIITLLLFYLLGGKKLFEDADKTTSDVITDDNLETIQENLPNTDPKTLLALAEDNKQFSRALQLYYLLVLKTLLLKKMIAWKPDKTNRMYLQELKNTPFYNSFKQVTLIFERVRYGNMCISETDYSQLKTTFEQILKYIDNPSRSTI